MIIKPNASIPEIFNPEDVPSECFMCGRRMEQQIRFVWKGFWDKPLWMHISCAEDLVKKICCEVKRYDTENPPPPEIKSPMDFEDELIALMEEESASKP